MFKFPKDFFWGASISSYQTEGNNCHTDWWEWEKQKGIVNSGLAANHYLLYKEDFSLAKSLNLNALRFSIEWARVQPKKNFFSEEEIRHYLEVVKTLREYNIEPIVTLHHFTNPLWFAREGGWLSKKSIDYFLDYVKVIVERLSAYVTYWVTINEPLVYLYKGYLLGEWPPEEKSFWKTREVLKKIIVAHLRAYKIIHSLYKKNRLDLPRISIAQNMIKFLVCKPLFKNKLASYLRDKFFNFYLLEKLISLKSLDFLGINYYTRQLVDIDRLTIRDVFLSVCNKGHNILKKNSLGWEIYPQGLYDLLLKLKRYNLDIIILENGICIDDDESRWEYIKEHLKSIYFALEKGVKIKGYFYWSLIDNFEWDKGFQPRFGLIEVNYQNFNRRIKESAKKFSVVCKTGILNEDD